MKLSTTRLKTYLTCPRQYRYCYVDEVSRPPSAPLLFGSAMHGTLCWLHEQRIERGEFPGLPEAVQTFNDRWRASISVDAPPFKVDTSVESYETLARLMLAVHFKVCRRSSVPLLLEFPFEVQIGQHTLVGILDRLDEGESGLVIVDYKSGQRKPSPSEIHRDLQLTCYAFAVQKLFNIPVESVVCHWLKDGIDLESTRGQGDFDWLTEEVVPHVAEGVKAGAFAPKPGYYCRFCDFREMCQAEGLEMSGPWSGKEAVAVEARGASIVADQGGAMWPMLSS